MVLGVSCGEPQTLPDLRPAKSWASEGRYGPFLLLTHPRARGDLPQLQAMVEAGATRPKEDGVSDCASPAQSYES